MSVCSQSAIYLPQNIPRKTQDSCTYSLLCISWGKLEQAAPTKTQQSQEGQNCAGVTHPVTNASPTRAQGCPS